jgi:hypothetical protein
VDRRTCVNRSSCQLLVDLGLRARRQAVHDREAADRTDREHQDEERHEDLPDQRNVVEP